STTDGSTTPTQTTTSPTAETAALPANMTDSGDPKININTAILSELDKLEAQLGIPALSNQIQASRPYGSTEDLVSKNVLTQEQYDQIKDQVTIEEIELTGEAKDVDYFTKLALMQGHMLVAGELLQQNLPDQADPHLGHPVEEIYVDVADQLPERNVAEFSDVLTRVQNLVKNNPTSPDVQPEYQKAVAAVDGAIAALPEAQRSSPAFVLKAVNEMLDVAAAEYTAALSGDKFTAAIEYQDSRGFVMYAKDTLLPKIEAQLTQTNASFAQDLKAKMETLAKAWPAAVPPATAVVPAADLANQVKAIEQASASAS
ncbi:MAG: helix-hairpin-helix domain-containing protein, partial [Leptolyngbyaceae cyanobacterium SM1_3_5]|nr:helix-hairpin-helix domain-containing protein [Leptolyngbyaceae cyanobacterium SM1_3_5]